MSTLKRASISLLTLLLLGATGFSPASAASAGAAGSLLWSSGFGDPATAAASLGSKGVWDGRANSSFATRAGKAAWNIHTPADTRHGSKSRASFTDLGFAPQTGLRLEYDVYVPSNDALALDIKLPGFASSPPDQSLWYASSGGNKQPDSGSIRIHVRPAGGWSVPHPYLEAYAYAERGGGKTYQDWGLYWRLSEKMNATGHVDGDELRIPVGTWSTITVEAEMNTPGKADGKLRVWLNGRQGIDINDLEWVTSGTYTWTQTMNDVFYNNGSHTAASWSIADMDYRKLTTTTTVAPAPTTGAPAPAPTTTIPARTTGPAAATPATAPTPATSRAPAPATPSGPGSKPAEGEQRPFAADVGWENVHRPTIEALYSRAVASGCDPSGSRYCPGALVSRAQMASFLARALQLPASGTDHFPDDEGSPHEDSIDRVAAAGITTGFPDGTFRPAAPVSREQMASFLHAALDLPETTSEQFDDVDGRGVHAVAVGAIASSGITTGCSASGSRFCPDASVRRDQMASFLIRAMDR